MGAPAVRSVANSPLRSNASSLRVAFLGPRVWLDGASPPVATQSLAPALFPTDGSGGPTTASAALSEFRPHACVVFDPASLPADFLRELPGVTLGVLVAGAPEAEAARGAQSLDRLVSFDPALTGVRVGSAEIWRAIPPPISDAHYRSVRPLHGAARAIAIGRSTAHREAMLLPAKHHHDLLQLIHGVSGQRLVDLLEEYDVGVYVAPDAGGGFGQQVGVHLAAGQLLLSEDLSPGHGLERNIDYLQVESPDGLVWALDRLARFPEMHYRIRVRGRLKAEQYRASRLFDRLTHDLLADVAAFGARQ